MKRILIRFGLVLGVLTFGMSCTTAYDSSGRAHKVVTPEGALLGVAAAGIVAYSLGKSRKRSRRSHSRDRYGSDYGYGHRKSYRSNDSYRDGGHRSRRDYGGHGFRGGYGHNNYAY